MRGRAHEVDRPESEVVDDVADVVLPAIQLGVTPSDRRRVRMHHAEAVIWRVPELANSPELGAPGRDLTHERSRPAPSDQPIARPVPGVIRKTRGLEVTEDSVRAVVVGVVLRRLCEPRIRWDGRRADRVAELVGQIEHVRGGRIGRCREWHGHDRQAQRNRQQTAKKRSAREIPPHR